MDGENVLALKWRGFFFYELWWQIKQWSHKLMHLTPKNLSIFVRIYTGFNWTLKVDFVFILSI